MDDEAILQWPAFARFRLDPLEHSLRHPEIVLQRHRRKLAILGHLSHEADKHREPADGLVPRGQGSDLLARIEILLLHPHRHGSASSNRGEEGYLIIILNRIGRSGILLVYSYPDSFGVAQRRRVVLPAPRQPLEELFYILHSFGEGDLLFRMSDFLLQPSKVEQPQKSSPYCVNRGASSTGSSRASDSCCAPAQNPRNRSSVLGRSFALALSNRLARQPNTVGPFRRISQGGPDRAICPGTESSLRMPR